MESQLQSALAVPALYAGGIAVHQRIIGHIAGHHRASTDKAIASEGDTADDGGIRANGGAFFHQGGFVLMLAGHMAARVDDIGEDHRRTEEDIVLDDHAGVERDIVLDLDIVPDDDIGCDEHILPDRAVCTDCGGRHDVGEVPDFGAGADGCAGVDVGGFVGEVVHFLAFSG